MLRVAAYFCKTSSWRGKEKTAISREKGQSFSMIYLGLHDLIYLHFHGHKHQEEIVNTFTVQHLSKEQIKTGSFLKKLPRPL